MWVDELSPLENIEGFDDSLKEKIQKSVEILKEALKTYKFDFKKIKSF
jgi:uncharacterized protein YjbJ (UPF0337 family)